ncbi:MAG: hypothetical protein JRI76_02720 [Deltaproteobacteria bacterium]|nr:hypothetical protein [Deltaproteobacteria bacterium]MBW2040924.1 hypothetical protein [Deltaproteobacteria bacterium]MBW2130980.1 hypothetical protein [Deltaproteobacteria bacterium]
MKRSKVITLLIALGVLMGTSTAVMGDGGPEPKPRGNIYYADGVFTATYADFDTNGDPQAYSIYAEIDFNYRNDVGQVEQIFKQITLTSKRESQDINICDFENDTLLAHYGTHQKELANLLEKMFGTNANKWEARLIRVKMDPYKSKNCDAVHGAKVEGTFLLRLEKKP